MFFFLGPPSYWGLFSPVVWFLPPRVQTLSVRLEEIHGWMNRIVKLDHPTRNEAGNKPCEAGTLTNTNTIVYRLYTIIIN